MAVIQGHKTHVVRTVAEAGSINHLMKWHIVTIVSCSSRASPNNSCWKETAIHNRQPQHAGRDTEINTASYHGRQIYPLRKREGEYMRLQAEWATSISIRVATKTNAEEN